jgi:hypothetical protein
MINQLLDLAHLVFQNKHIWHRTIFHHQLKGWEGNTDFEQLLPSDPSVHLNMEAEPVSKMLHSVQTKHGRVKNHVLLQQCTSD